MYEEKEYWDKRANPNSASEVITTCHLVFVEGQLGNAEYIIDFGPGVGRTFPAYKNVKKVVGWDITRQYAIKAIEESKKYDFDFDFHCSDEIGNTPYRSKFFDAAVCVSVLLHQRPHNILKMMNELKRVAKKAIVITAFDRNAPWDVPCEEEKEYSKHCFNYNYFDICKENGWKMHDKYWEDDLYLMFTY
jgi:SAM-dependent methyltransferase